MYHDMAIYRYIVASLLHALHAEILFYYLQISYRSCNEVEVDPDCRDANPSQDGIEAMKRFISKHTTGVSTTPSIVEPCMLMVSVWLKASK